MLLAIQERLGAPLTERHVHYELDKLKKTR